TSLVFIGGVSRQARGMRPSRGFSLASCLQPNAFLGPAEHGFELSFGKFDQHRPAVRALRGEIDFVEIAEQGEDLVALELAVRANHAMTGDGRETLFEAILQLAARADVGDLGDHPPDSLAIIAGGKERRRRADHVFAGPSKPLYGEADAIQ